MNPDDLQSQNGPGAPGPREPESSSHYKANASAAMPRIVDFAWRANLDACIDEMRSEGGGQYFD